MNFNKRMGVCAVQLMEADIQIFFSFINHLLFILASEIGRKHSINLHKILGIMDINPLTLRPRSPKIIIQNQK